MTDSLQLETWALSQGGWVAYDGAVQEDGSRLRWKLRSADAAEPGRTWAEVEQEIEDQYKLSLQPKKQKPALKIVVSGLPRTGKTATVRLIQTALENVGLTNFTVEDPDINNTSKPAWQALKDLQTANPCILIRTKQNLK